ncbi:hypothetical protein RCL_jg6819.t1 [Rhizophagus clarus]|uniref:Uncharacterized protein n=1 Tax=Rhizophagus clarus TaxID=94130 RepID=A0A8H3QLJ5_9GLOM|nr:hypothetical protein RCL_jg6819.t1 [Rhizophagus clarus]
MFKITIESSGPSPNSFQKLYVDISSRNALYPEIKDSLIFYKYNTKLQAFSQISSLELDNWLALWDIQTKSNLTKLTSRLRILAISSSDSWHMNREHIGSRKAVFKFLLGSIGYCSFYFISFFLGDSVVIILKVWTWILIISQVSDGIPARKSAPLKPDKVS